MKTSVFKWTLGFALLTLVPAAQAQNAVNGYNPAGSGSSMGGGGSHASSNAGGSNYSATSTQNGRPDMTSPGLGGGGASAEPERTGSGIAGGPGR